MNECKNLSVTGFLIWIYCLSRMAGYNPQLTYCIAE